MPLDPKDTQDIIALNGLYAHYIDHGEAEKWADLFQPGGIWQRANASISGGERREPVIFSTRQQLIEFAREVHKVQRGLTRHVSMNMVIDGSGASASGRNTTLLIDARETPIRIGVIADFDDEYQKTPQGWRFKRRTARLTP